MTETTVGAARVIVSADTRQFTRGLTRDAEQAGKRASEGIRSKMGAALKVAGGAFAAGAVVKGLKSVTDAASDLGESVNAVEVTFGDAAKGVLELSDASAKTVGLSKKDFNGLAVQFSSFATQVAGDGGDVVGVLDDLTGRSADFASVMNIDVADAARTFQSGLAGETEPLKKYGLDLSAAAVGAYAVANGIAESASEMTEADKVQARYGLLMEQTAKTAGDFANTSDSLANRQRIVKASFEDAKAEMGQAFLPVAEQVAKFVSEKLVPGFRRLAEWITQDAVPAVKRIVERFRDLARSPIVKVLAAVTAGFAGVIAGMVGFAVVAGKVSAGMKLIRGGLLLVRGAMVAFSATMLANPIVLVIAAIVAAVAGLIVWFRHLYKTNEEFRARVQAVWAKVKELWGQLWAAVKKWWEQTGRPIFDQVVKVVRDTLWPIVKTYLGKVRDWWADTWGAIQRWWEQTGRAVFDQVVTFVRDILWPLFKKYVGLLRAYWTGVAKAIWWAVQNVLVPAFRWVWEFVRDTLWPNLKRVWGWISAAWDGLVKAAKWAWEKVLRPAFKAVWWYAEHVLWPYLQIVFAAVRKAWEVLVAALRWAWNNVLKPVFRAVWTFLRDTVWPRVRQVFDWVRDKVETIFKAVQWAWNNILKPALKAVWSYIRDTLWPKVKPIFEKFAEGFRTAARNIRDWWGKLKGWVMAPITFVVETVLNKGLIRAINWVADKLGSKARIGTIPWPPGGNKTAANTGRGVMPMGGAGGRGGVDWAGAAGALSPLLSLVLRSDSGAAKWLRARTPIGSIRDGGRTLVSALKAKAGDAVRWGGDYVKDKLLGLGDIGARGRKGAVLPAGSYRIGTPFDGYKGHKGADYPAPIGTPVFSPYPGVVSSVKHWTTSYGRHVWVTHANGQRSLYAHLSATSVRPGQILGAGFPVGRVGSTGNSTGPHLHFEWMLPNGTKVNPDRLGLFDTGGLLGHGGMAVNMSGRPELILSPAQTAEVLRAGRMDTAGRAPTNVTVNNYYPKPERASEGLAMSLRQARWAGAL